MKDLENLDVSTDESDPSCVTTRSKFAAMINIAVLETCSTSPKNQPQEASWTKQSALHMVSKSDSKLYTATQPFRAF